MAAFIPAVSVGLVGSSCFHGVAAVTNRRQSVGRRIHSRSRALIIRSDSTEEGSTPPPAPPAETEIQPTSSKTSASDNSSEERRPPFEIRGFSLANVFLGIGGLITISSFSTYLTSAGTASASSIGFVYGVPILLVGCALKYAELQPVRVDSDEDVKAVRVAKGTKIQQQIYKDITRHRYGDEAHLSAALSSLEMIPRGEACPVLQYGVEREVDGEYEIELVFYSVATPFRTWKDRIQRCERFFGPGVQVIINKIDAEKRLVGMAIRSTSNEQPGNEST